MESGGYWKSVPQRRRSLNGLEGALECSPQGLKGGLVAVMGQPSWDSDYLLRLKGDVPQLLDSKEL